MHWIYSTRQNRIVIARLKQTADDGILKRRYAHCVRMTLATFFDEDGFLLSTNDASLAIADDDNYWKMIE